jgi:hypothetical protein
LDRLQSKIGMQAAPPVKRALVRFLKEARTDVPAVLPIRRRFENYRAADYGRR